MTALLDPMRARVSFVDVLAGQLAGIDAFHRARHDQARAVAAGSREQRMDADRRREILQRQHRALVARCDRSLRLTGGPLVAGGGRTALVGHRQPWFAGKLSSLLADRGVTVLGHTELGPDLVGWAVAEQPELVVVEDTLVMQTGIEVVREVRRYCPGAAIAAVVPYGDRIGPLLDAGADTGHVRTVPPAQLADDLLGLLTA